MRAAWCALALVLGCHARKPVIEIAIDDGSGVARMTSVPESGGTSLVMFASHRMITVRIPELPPGLYDVRITNVRAGTTATAPDALTVTWVDPRTSPP